jgi:secondary thiamine-phosphate synthase enzyme
VPDRSATIVIESSGREELVDVTPQVQAVIRASKVTRGVICLWCLHTTCALTVNEGADPDVARDLIHALGQLVPERGDYRHSEGNSDAHIKTSLLGPGLTLLIDRSELVLGTWQHVFLVEWDGPRRREIAFMLLPA